MISGQCGRESGKEHAKILQTTLDGSKKSRLRTVCIASDGESRRGEALIQMTFKHVLSEDSNIHGQLYDLPFMNLEVGDDDIMADKDFKHIFKRGRNLGLRARGFIIHGIHIFPSLIRSHLLESGVSRTHVDNLLKPDDKQDVKLAYDLLRELWALPEVSDSSRPGFQDTREALRTLGIFFRHLLSPYICVDLSLSEQLVHLSAAAHMLLAMLHEDNAGTKLMPTQLYQDIMIMIKNVFFCVAKLKIDNPLGNFFIILLGTDRLEEIFGILRTMIGYDASLDILQLLQRLGGTTEVSSILAKHPEWDRSPRRLKLPALDKNGLDVHKGVDHIKPASWRGDVNVSNVNLKTCWMLGRKKVKEIPRLDAVLRKIEALKDLRINILRPFGKDIVHARRDPEDYDDTAETFDDGLGSNSCSDENLQPVETALEDAAVEEEQGEKHNPCFELDGQKVWKGRYLSQRFKDLKNPGSRDRLKRYADVPRYAMKQGSMPQDLTVIDDTSSTVKLDSPITSLIKCEGRLFVAVGEVNDLTFDSKHVEQITVDQLSEPTALVGFQLLYIIPATTEDDPACVNDWRWSFQRGASYQVPGRLVEPIDPPISLKTAGKPTYLFDSRILQSIGSLLFERLTRDDAPRVPAVSQSPNFPYREESGQACFVCADERKEEEILAPKTCAHCSNDLPAAPQRLLEHNAMHILYDPNIKALSEPCGLCLRPSPACTFKLAKGKGAGANPRINKDGSSCANIATFNYGAAMVSSTSSPSSNVPINCPHCSSTASAVWKYNMKAHLIDKHPYVDLEENKSLWAVSNTERSLLKALWNNRNKVKKTRRSKNNSKPTLSISAAHSSRLTLWYV